MSKVFFNIILICFTSISSFDVFGKEIWECDKKYDARIGRDVNNKYEYNAGSDSGSIHVFSGVGTPRIELRFKHDLKGSPDVLERISADPLASLLSHTYFAKSPNATVIWTFYINEKAAIKSFSYTTGGNVVTHTGFYTCK